MTPISITLVELPPTQFGKLNGTPSRDVYSLFKLPARALHVLEGILRAEGYKDVEVINPIYHGNNRKLTEENFKRIFKSEILGISTITRTSLQSLELAREYKKRHPKGLVIVGGSDSKFRAEEYLNNGADIVVMGEGEKTLQELSQRQFKDFNEIKGIAYKRKNELVINQERALLSSEELSGLPHPIYDNQTGRGVSSAVIETTRGCPHNCFFCSVTSNYGRRYRLKSIDYVLEEIRRVRKIGRSLFLTDDNFTGDQTRAIRILEAIKVEKLSRRLSAQVTVMTAKNFQLLKALKDAGVSILYVGFESISDVSLKDVNKSSNAEMNREAAKIFRNFGFWIHGMLIPGIDSDTPESLKEMLSWAKKNLDSVQFLPLTPLPGTPYWDQIEEEKRFLTKDFSLYDVQHVVVRPKNFTPYQLQKMVYNMYEDFYSVKESLKRLSRSPRKIISTTITAYTSFGGIKKVLYDKQSLSYLEFLKSVS